MCNQPQLCEGRLWDTAGNHMLANLCHSHQRRSVYRGNQQCGGKPQGGVAKRSVKHSDGQILRIHLLVVEPVADVSFRQQILRIGRVIFNLHAQLTHICP
jgi:hypothetical protein